jgi:hypothetical protein
LCPFPATSCPHQRPGCGFAAQDASAGTRWARPAAHRPQGSGTSTKSWESWDILGYKLQQQWGFCNMFFLMGYMLKNQQIEKKTKKINCQSIHVYLAVQNDDVP